MPRKEKMILAYQDRLFGVVRLASVIMIMMNNRVTSHDFVDLLARGSNLCSRFECCGGWRSVNTEGARLYTRLRVGGSGLY